MRRKLVSLAVVGLFAACGFPGVSYENGGSDGGPDSSTQPDASHDAPADATTDGEASSSGGDDASGEAEASPGTDAADDGSDSSMSADTGTDGSGMDGEASTDGPVEAANGDGGDANATDASGDAVEESPADTGVDAPVCDFDGDHDLAKGGVCGGTDCDDHDARAYFGEPNFLTFTPTAVTNGDWNCDGVVTPQFTTGFNCGLLSTGSCGAASGFTDTPGCGATSANFITCKVSTAVLCVTNTTTSNTQGCK